MNARFGDDQCFHEKVNELDRNEKLEFTDFYHKISSEFFRVFVIIIQIFRKVIRNISNSFGISVVRGNTSGDSE